jgi:dTDP-glucose pyrophosphorylase
MYLLMIAGNYQLTDSSSSELVQLDELAKSMPPNSNVVIASNIELPQSFDFSTKRIKYCKVPTGNAGALATAAFGLKDIPDDTSFVVVPTNATILNDRIEDFYNKVSRESAMVAAIIFQGSDPQYSYARLDRSGRIVEIVEKKVSGSCALAGVYYFKNKKKLVECAEWAMVNNIQNEGRFYISPSLNYFLTNSTEISLFEINESEYRRH